MKRIISTVLLAAIIAACVSCGDTSEPKDTSADTSSDIVEPNDELYSDLPVKDFNETVISILSYSSGSMLDLEYLNAEQTGDVIDDALYMRRIETEQRLNMKFEFIATVKDTEAITTFTNSVLAGDDEFDMFAMKSYALGNILQKGVIMNWDNIEGIDYSKPWYVKDAMNTFTFGNKVIGVLTDALATNMTCCWSFVFNKRIADDWQVPDLYQIVRNGDWTMDMVMTVTKDIWNDLNGNSERDEDDVYGLYLDNGGPLDAFMLSHGIASIRKDENDYPVLDFYSERLVKSFEKCYSLLWENTGTYVQINKGTDVLPYYRYIKNFTNGQGMMSPMFINYLLQNDMRSMEDEYGLLPYPKLDEEQEEYVTYTLPRGGAFFLPVNLSAEKQDMVGYVVEVMSAYSYKYLNPAVYDVSLSQKGVRDEESIEMLGLIFANRKYDFSAALQLGGSFQFTQDKTYRNLLNAKNKDISSYYAANESAAKTYIENIIKVFKDMT